MPCDRNSRLCQDENDPTAVEWMCLAEFGEKERLRFEGQSAAWNCAKGASYKSLVQMQHWTEAAGCFARAQSGFLYGRHVQAAALVIFDDFCTCDEQRQCMALAYEMMKSYEII